MSPRLDADPAAQGRAHPPMAEAQPRSRCAADVPRRVRVASLSIVAILTFAVYWPTLHNGFLPLGFDDGLILDTVAIRTIRWPDLRALLTTFNHAHYVPLTMLSWVFDYQVWGLNPVGYHFGNLLLHTVAAMLVCVFLWPIVPSAGVALVAALIFALHPLQMEAVSVAVQRKTVLSGVLFLLTLIGYQRWRRTRSRSSYAVCVATFLAATLAKPSVVMLPLVLVLYDYAVAEERVRIADKLPFVAIAVVGTGCAIGAHAAVGALSPLHGGTLLTNVLMVSRVTLEYVDALFLPVNLSPIYYYPKDLAYSPLNVLALVLIVAVCGWVTVRRHRYRWSFFCLWWSLLVLFPESNLLPLAQLRADRFLYLVIVAFGLWIALGIHRARQTWSTGWGRMCSRLAAPVLVGVLAALTYRSAGVWHDEVSAWNRVRERHPWCAMAHNMAGQASYDAHDWFGAERSLRESIRLSPQLPEPHLYLAKVYADRGQNALARMEVQRFLELVPGDAEGLRLQTALYTKGS